MLKTSIFKIFFSQHKCLKFYTTFSVYSNKYINCGDINEDFCDQRVTLHGWLHHSRIKGKMLLLRDHSGIIQLIPTSKELSAKVPNLESVICVEGVVHKRPIDQINKKMKTGEFEMLIDKLEVINESSKSLPLIIKSFDENTETVRMKYRYLDLRREEVQNIFRFRSKLEFKFCEFLIKHNNFVNIGTPSLFKSTPGGAREFIVPTKDAGYCYSLIQSPQQHKQLLMVGGFDRYMQLARCYRDEMSRPDRQPEFTQLDIEMSFVEQHHLRRLLEDMLVFSLKETCPTLEAPFIVLSYSQSMFSYGTDRPDIRFGLLLNDFVCEGDDYVGILLSRDLFMSLESSELADCFASCLASDIVITILDSQKRNVQMKNSPNHECVENDFIICAKNTDNCDTRKEMGNVRLSLGAILHQKSKIDYCTQFAFVWIDRFPLFQTVNGQLKSVHHPFTSPIKEHIDQVYSDPTKVISEQFDLVCNGIELGGGSIRIHDSTLQEFIIREILKEDVSAFSHLLTALQSGAPPHGGFALGNDRLLTCLLGLSSIREVIAFPKTAQGRDLMSGAPDMITNEQSDYYHLNFKNVKHRRDFST